MTDLASHINQYEKNEIAVVPAGHMSKAPVLKNWQTTEVGTYDASHFTNGNTNIAGVMGDKSNELVDIDLDCPEAITIADRYLPKTGWIFGRPSAPDSHRLYRVTDAGKPMKFQGPNGEGTLVEFRADKCATVLPPSVHPSGETVEFSMQDEIAKVDRAELLNRLAELGAASLIAKHWHQGSRHETSLALAGWLAVAGWSHERVEYFIESVCLAADDGERADRQRAVRDTFEKLDNGELVAGFGKLTQVLDPKVVERVGDWLGLQQPDEFPSIGHNGPPLDPEEELAETDLGNAWRFIKQHSGQIHFCKGIGWIAWNGRFWETDADDLVAKKAQKTTESIVDEIKQLDDYEKRKSRLQFARRSANQGRMQATIETAKPWLSLESEFLDRDPFLLNCANGTLDLRTGELADHDPAQLITHCLDVPYNSRADCPRFNEFLGTITGGDQELRRFIERALGYSLTGSTKEQCFFIPYGAGANGKSTLLNLMDDLLGDLAKNTPVETLMIKKGSGGISNDVARLHNARFVQASEGEANHRLAEALIKRMTGGEKLSVRFLFREHFEFAPKFKIWFPTNHKPQVRGEDEAIWRRIYLIPFKVVIPKEQQDPDLLSKLKEEREGILALLVRACLEWQKEGLNPPPSVRAATSDYQMEMDVVGRFLEEETERVEGSHLTKDELHRKYESWCQEEGVNMATKRELTMRMKKLGYDERRTGGLGRHWNGLRLKHPELDEYGEDNVAA